MFLSISLICGMFSAPGFSTVLDPQSVLFPGANPRHIPETGASSCNRNHFVVSLFYLHNEKRRRKSHLATPDDGRALLLRFPRADRLF
ncbi:hypothetical protein HZ326_10974 [Fusarium oxysporum f. sp. albedinis]|nr:hypothetical protein HZ326_10974 [Fusarium oxysporum f. sp. albedinis]